MGSQLGWLMLLMVIIILGFLMQLKDESTISIRFRLLRRPLLMAVLLSCTRCLGLIGESRRRLIQRGRGILSMLALIFPLSFNCLR